MSRVVADLVRRPLESNEYEGQIADWGANVLAPALPAEDRGDDHASLESRLARALTGAGSPAFAATRRTIAWEGQSYQVDLTERALRRLPAIRAAENGCSLDDALALTQAA